VSNILRFHGSAFLLVGGKVRTIDQMVRTSGARSSVVLGLALGGVLAGHALTYRLLLPDAHARAAELANSGHGYLSGANAIGLVAIMAALCVTFLRELLVREPGRPAAVLGRLCAFQLSAFVAMEIAERVGSGSGMHHVGQILAVGIPAQVLVAAAVALVMRWVVRAASVAATARGRGGVATPGAALPLSVVPASFRPARVAFAIPAGRAPPSVR
jgi:hypothetical protein